MRAVLAIVSSVFLSSVNAAYEANGVGLGASEAQVRQKFPSAHCKALEWQSLAADRRCDDSRAEMEGVKVRVTFYLRKDAVQAFDVRFETRDLDKLLAVLRKSYGPPASEGKENVERDGKSRRVFYRALWKNRNDRAVLTAELSSRRGSMLASRGNFEEEIYRVR